MSVAVLDKLIPDPVKDFKVKVGFTLEEIKDVPLPTVFKVINESPEIIAKNSW